MATLTTEGGVVLTTEGGVELTTEGGSDSSSTTVIARPASDVSTGSWSSTAATLAEVIDEAVPNDADYIETTATGDVCEVALDPVTDPNSSTGHVVRYRAVKTGPDTRALTVRLMQGATEIAAWTHGDLSETATTYEQALSAAQADAITDYADLRLRFET